MTPEYDLILQAITDLKERFDRFDEKQDAQIAAVYKKMSDDFVTCKEFDPVRNAVYAAIGIIGVAVIGALITLVLK